MPLQLTLFFVSGICFSFDFTFGVGFKNRDAMKHLRLIVPKTERNSNQNAAAKYHFFSPFRSDSPLAEHLKEMYLKLEKQRDSRK